MFLFSPIEMFEINIPTGICKIFFSSFSLEIFTTLIFFIIIIFMFSNTINPFNFNTSIILWKFLYNFLLNIFKENLNSLRSLKYFPILLSLMLFIFVLNITGLIFFDVSLTSHIFLTLFLSFSFFILFFITALINFDKNYIFKFIENDINISLKIILFFIEIISFLIRPFSLGIRLFTNMLSGHVLLHIFLSFFLYICKNYIYLFFIPFIIIFLIFTLEIFISFIQTYVFIVLLVIYLKDMYELH